MPTTNRRSFRPPWLRYPLAAITVLGLTTPTTAQIVVDPGGGGTHTDLQAGIDAAPPGGTVRVVGGSHPNVVVTKSLTIVGDPQPHIFSPSAGPGFPAQAPAIEMSGTGSNRLELVNLRIGDATGSGIAYSTLGEGIAGAGFTELALQDCIVRGHSWFEVTGTTTGTAAIDSASLTRISIVRSDVRGEDVARCPFDEDFLADGAPALLTPGASVAVSDSIVVGGGVDLSLLSLVFYPSPPDPVSCPCAGTGNGGPGIVATAVHSVQSTIAGGSGSVVFWNGVPWGQQSDGLATIAATFATIPQTLISLAAPTPGASFTLTFTNPTVDPTALLLGRPTTAPFAVSGESLFVDALAPIASIPIAAGSVAFVLTIPASTPIGLETGWQLASATPGLVLSNPVIEIVAP